MDLNDEQRAREFLHQLKEYYTSLAIQGLIVLICLLVWIFSGGYFWPIWVILALGAHALVTGIKLGVFPMLQDIFPFLKSDWEEKKLKELISKDKNHTDSQ